MIPFVKLSLLGAFGAIGLCSVTVWTNSKVFAQGALAFDSPEFDGNGADEFGQEVDAGIANATPQDDLGELDTSPTGNFEDTGSFGDVGGFDDSAFANENAGFGNIDFSDENFTSPAEEATGDFTVTNGSENLLEESNIFGADAEPAIFDNGASNDSVETVSAFGEEEQQAPNNLTDTVTGSDQAASSSNNNIPLDLRDPDAGTSRINSFGNLNAEFLMNEIEGVKTANEPDTVKTAPNQSTLAGQVLNEVNISGRAKQNSNSSSASSEGVATGDSDVTDGAEQTPGFGLPDFGESSLDFEESPPSSIDALALSLPPPNEFSGAPPVPGTARIMARGEAPEEYQVQLGDTLFDICDQLLGEPAYWPKLWALNPDIKNPHFIYPNMKLQFYPGDDETPPFLRVIPEEDVIPIAQGDLVAQSLIAETVLFEAEEVHYKESPLVDLVAPSQVTLPAELFDAFVTGGGSYNSSEVQLTVPGFIYAQQREAQGYVIGGRQGQFSLSAGQQAWLESTGTLTPGSTMTIIRPGEKIVNPSTGDTVGYKYYFVGNIRIERMVDSGNVAVGTVEQSRLTVRPDDLVVSFISTKRRIPSGQATGSLSGVTGHIVGFEYEGKSFGGVGHYAFIDKGSGDGVAPGMYLPVFSSPDSFANSASKIDSFEDYQSVGVVRIIDATDAGSVGFIVSNKQEIRIGDRTSKG